MQLQPHIEPEIRGRGFSIGRVKLGAGAGLDLQIQERARIVLVYSGLWIDDCDEQVLVNPGEVLFQAPKTSRDDHSPNGCELIVADLDRSFVDPFLVHYAGRPRTLQYSFHSFDDAPERLHEEIFRNDAPSPLLLEALLLQMLALGARAASARDGRPKWLNRTLTHIHLNAHQPLTIGGLAAISAVSASRLSHGFRAHMGTSVMSYIRGYRLRIAARALRQTNRPIKDIALSYGFYDPAHFSREFSRAHNMSPLEYRRRLINGQGVSVFEPPTAHSAHLSETAESAAVS